MGYYYNDKNDVFDADFSNEDQMGGCGFNGYRQEGGPGGFFGPGGPFTPGFPGVPGGMPGFPGVPGGFPGVPGGFPGGQSFGPPSGAPPAFIPSMPLQQQVGVFAIDPGAIRRCLFRFVYIWLNNGQNFWAWLVFVGPRSVAGFRWIDFRWIYFGIDINRIASFTCF